MPQHEPNLHGRPTYGQQWPPPQRGSHPYAPAAGPVGTTFTITDASDTYQVTLTKVIDPAQPHGESSQPSSGHRLVTAVFTIKDVSGQASDYTGFGHGASAVGSGATFIGAVAFEVPMKVNVASIQWTPSSGLPITTATWNVGGGR